VGQTVAELESLDRAAIHLGHGVGGDVERAFSEEPTDLASVGSGKGDRKIVVASRLTEVRS
jgi:hypothetical protein